MSSAIQLDQQHTPTSPLLEYRRSPVHVKYDPIRHMECVHNVEYCTRRAKVSFICMAFLYVIIMGLCVVGLVHPQMVSNWQLALVELLSILILSCSLAPGLLALRYTTQYPGLALYLTKSFLIISFFFVCIITVLLAGEIFFTLTTYFHNCGNDVICLEERFSIGIALCMMTAVALSSSLWGILDGARLKDSIVALVQMKRARLLAYDALDLTPSDVVAANAAGSSRF
eukprot:TRINITY_DN8744_c0_g2_i1.p1 TRINITY_DN8744_c0_g2~~TRINITY_DN8744_c0_g2_i1.p1  ORF type:complete len:256 (-),score=31.94 TRINITY_DN8744_c0_g2_i1:14-697(-)